MLQKKAKQIKKKKLVTNNQANHASPVLVGAVDQGSHCVVQDDNCTDIIFLQGEREKEVALR